MVVGAPQNSINMAKRNFDALSTAADTNASLSGESIAAVGAIVYQEDESGSCAPLE